MLKDAMLQLANSKQSTLKQGIIIQPQCRTIANDTQSQRVWFKKMQHQQESKIFEFNKDCNNETKVQ